MSVVWVKKSKSCFYSKHSDEAYGPWEENSHFSVDEATFEEQLGSCWDGYLVNEESQIVYAVVLRYSEGDSFGRSTGCGDVAYVFSDLNKAKECAKIVEKEEKEFSIKFDIEDGEGGYKQFTYGNPAAGYFESLDDVEVEPILVS